MPQHTLGRRGTGVHRLLGSETPTAGGDKLNPPDEVMGAVCLFVAPSRAAQYYYSVSVSVSVSVGAGAARWRWLSSSDRTTNAEQREQRGKLLAHSIIMRGSRVGGQEASRVESSRVESNRVRRVCTACCDAGTRAVKDANCVWMDLRSSSRRHTWAERRL
jgi:hypothetical protein